MSKFYVVSTAFTPIDDGDAELSVDLITTDYTIALKTLLLGGKSIAASVLEEDDNDFSELIEQIEDNPILFWEKLVKKYAKSSGEGLLVRSYYNHPQDARLQCYGCLGHEIMDLSVQQLDEGPIKVEKTKPKGKPKMKSKK